MEVHQSNFRQFWGQLTRVLRTGAGLVWLTGGGRELILSAAVPPKTNGRENVQQDSIQDPPGGGFATVSDTKELTLKDERER